MCYKTILVPVADASTAPSPLDAAFKLAARFGSHVTALHVRTDPTAAVPLVGEGMSGAMVEEMLSVAEKQGAKRADEARAAFDTMAARHGMPVTAAPRDGFSAEWLDITGREEEAVAWRGRLSDLVVMGRPGDGAEIPSLMTLNAALMESGRPLLLVPPQPVEDFGHHIAIAWNGSAEAARAVAFSLPLMRKAAAVTILSVTEDERTAGAPAGELVQYLARHGIKAECKLLQVSHHAGEELMKQVEALGADMVVMGAYTHSRLRQLILGGVTRHVLHHAAVPALMCH